MTINDCLHMVSQSPSDFGIRFWTEYGQTERLIPRAYGLLSLYADWWDKCECCPENDAYIYGMEFYNNNTGQVFYVEGGANSEFTFEDLMHVTEDILKLR